VVAVQAQTSYGDMEMGRGFIYLDSIPHSSSVSQASSRCKDQPDEADQHRALAEQVQGADMWVDILHQRSERLIGRLLLHVGQLNVSTS